MAKVKKVTRFQKCRYVRMKDCNIYSPDTSLANLKRGSFHKVVSPPRRVAPDPRAVWVLDSIGNPVKIFCYECDPLPVALEKIRTKYKDMAHLHEKLKKVAEEQNVSMYRIAIDLGISAGNISRYFKTGKTIGKKTATKIANYLGYDIAEELVRIES